jgi:crossover junction endodeoxyribonuclease RuvC
MLVVGVDPGIRGGISGLDTEKKTLWSIETPVLLVDQKKKKFDYDIHRIAALFRAANPDLICLEAVHSMPAQGVSSVFNFGRGFGILLGIIGTLGIPLRLVTPRVWKARLGITADKETSRIKANQVFPACKAFWKLKKHDGLCESALLSFFALDNLPLDLIIPENIFDLYEIAENTSVRNPRPPKRTKPAKILKIGSA